MADFDPNSYLQGDSGSFNPDTYLNPPSGVESFARAAANNVPLAPQVIAGGESLLNDSDYSANLKDWNDKAAGAKAANPVTYGVGAAVGSLAPLALPGVGEAMEAAPIASNAALGAANAVSNTDLSKDPGTALKQAGEGALVGGTVGKVADMLPDMGEVANKLGNEHTLNQAGVTPAMLSKMSSGVERTPQDVGNELAAFLKDHADMGSSKGDMFESLENFRKNQAGPAVGNAIQDIAKAGGREAGDSSVWLPIGDLYNEYKSSPLPAQRELAKQIEPILSHLAQKSKATGGLTIDDIEPLLQGVGKAYAKTSPTSEMHGVYGEIYGALSKARENIADQVAASTNNPGLKQALLKANKDYALVSKLGPAAKGMAAREAMGQNTGTKGVGMLGRMFGSVPAAIRYPAAVAMGAAGHVMGAGSLMTPELMNKGVQAAGARAMDSAAKPTQAMLNDFFASQKRDSNAK
jgi:hypothetical protein